jgi:hypothetical protein
MPRRGAGSGFSETVKPTAPSPCPLAPEVIAIHGAALDADHVHSRFVLTLIVPTAPVAGADGRELLAETWHFDPVGEVTETDVEPHPAVRHARSNAHQNGRAHIALEHSASVLPRISIEEVLDRICLRIRSSTRHERSHGNQREM